MDLREPGLGCTGLVSGLLTVGQRSGRHEPLCVFSDGLQTAGGPIRSAACADSVRALPRAGPGRGRVAGQSACRRRAAHAQTAAQARGAAVELQFSQAFTAAEVLGALARQSGGGISNFQTVALELLASRPGLASLELQPGGVVSDIVPRAGHERAIGFNVLKDAAHRPGAYAAIQRRVLTVTGPLTLYPGEPGIVVRVPVFQDRQS